MHKRFIHAEQQGLNTADLARSALSHINPEIQRVFDASNNTPEAAKGRSSDPQRMQHETYTN